MPDDRDKKSTGKDMIEAARTALEAKQAAKGAKQKLPTSRTAGTGMRSIPKKG